MNPWTISYFVLKHRRLNFWPSLRSATIHINNVFLKIDSFCVIFHALTNDKGRTNTVHPPIVVEKFSYTDRKQLWFGSAWQISMHDLNWTTWWKYFENITIFDFDWEFWFFKFNERNQTQNVTQHYCLTLFAFTLEFSFGFCFLFILFPFNRILFKLLRAPTVVERNDIFGFYLLDIHGSLTSVWIVNDFKMYSLFNQYTKEHQFDEMKVTFTFHIFLLFVSFFPVCHVVGQNVEIGNTVIIFINFFLVLVVLQLTYCL